jgi:hypothetical protein
MTDEVLGSMQNGISPERKRAAIECRGSVSQETKGYNMQAFHENATPPFDKYPPTR